MGIKCGIQKTRESTMTRIAFILSVCGFAAFAGASSSEPKQQPQQVFEIKNYNVTVSETKPLLKLARLGANAYGYKATDLTIEPVIAELLRLRVSQINHCSYCLDVHYKAARDMKIPQIKIDTLSAWWATNLYTDAEKAALTYTEALTRLDNDAMAKHFPRYHQQLTKYYSEKEIVELAGIVINMNIWTRLKLAEGALPNLSLTNTDHSGT